MSSEKDNDRFQELYQEFVGENTINSTKTVGIDSYGNIYEIGDKVTHDGAVDPNQVGTISMFSRDEESEEIKAHTEHGWAHLDFIEKVEE